MTIRCLSLFLITESYVNVDILYLLGQTEKLYVPGVESWS